MSNNGMDQGLAGVVKQVAELQRAACVAQQAAESYYTFDVPDGKGGAVRMVVARKDGAILDKITLPKEPRRYMAHGLDAVVGLAVFAAGAFAPAKVEGKPNGVGMLVLVSPERVRLYFEEATRREYADFFLIPSQAYRSLLELERLANAEWKGELRGNETPWMDQRRVIDFLRVRVNGETEPGDLVEVLRQLRVKSASGGESTVKTGKESMGKSILAEVSGLGDAPIPEDVELSACVYDNLHFDDELLVDRVACDLSTRVGEGLFRLTPKAGELIRIQQGAMRKVRLYLEERLEAQGLTAVPVELGEHP